MEQKGAKKSNIILIILTFIILAVAIFFGIRLILKNADKVITQEVDEESPDPVEIDLGQLEPDQMYRWTTKSLRPVNYVIVANNVDWDEAQLCYETDKEDIYTLFCPQILTSDGVKSNSLTCKSKKELRLHFTPKPETPMWNSAERTAVVFLKDLEELSKEGKLALEPGMTMTIPNRDTKFIYNNSNLIVDIAIQNEDGTLSDTFTLEKGQIISIGLDSKAEIVFTDIRRAN